MDQRLLREKLGFSTRLCQQPTSSQQSGAVKSVTWAEQPEGLGETCQGTWSPWHSCQSSGMPGPMWNVIVVIYS